MLDQPASPAPPPFPSLTPALTPISKPSTLTDAQITKHLLTYRPVTSERNIWAFWDKGYAALPPWLRRNVQSWHRRLSPTWTIRVVDLVPDSPNYIAQYTDLAKLPACIQHNNMTGPNAGQHASDIVRLALLYAHGGIWLDVSTILFADPDDLCWTRLASSASPYEFFSFQIRIREHWGQITTQFMAARRRNPLVKHWMSVFYALWRDRRCAAGLATHPLIAHLGYIDAGLGMRAGIGEVDPVALTDYLALNFAFERVKLTVDARAGWNGPAYWRKHVLLLDGMRELYASQGCVSLDAQASVMARPFLPHLLGIGSDSRASMRVSSSSDSSLSSCSSRSSADLGQSQTQAQAQESIQEQQREREREQEQKEAHTWLTHITSDSAAVKFSGGWWTPESTLPKPLAKTWSEAGHEEDDVRAGTWAAWFRYAATHLKQTRLAEDVYAGIEVPEVEERVLYAGMLEAATAEEGWELNGR